jgi:hypothetical protein
MADRYSQIANNPLGRLIFKNVGLPQPVPLERHEPGTPVVDGAVLLGAAPGGRLDTSALECVARFAGLWLEIIAMRRTGMTATEHEAERVPHAAAAYAPAPVTEPATSAEPAYTPAAPAATTETAPAVAVAVAPATDDEELHRKARRFAKLLVDEIKLYNQAKVSEGRAQRDLYQRLKDDIDKSRATYERRYAGTAAAAGNYFTTELIRILANDDPSLLGSGFPG